MSKTIVWSKDNCTFCVKAKELLDSKKISYEERNINGPDWTPEDFFNAVPNARSFPQIYIDGRYIGNYDNMVSHIALGDLTL